MPNSGNECSNCGRDVSSLVDDGQDEGGPRETCRVCADPGAYSSTVGSPGVSKSAEQKQKEDHVW